MVYFFIIENQFILACANNIVNVYPTEWWNIERVYNYLFQIGSYNELTLRQVFLA